MVPQITAEKFNELEIKHGDLFTAETGQGVFLFRRATKPEYRRATDKVQRKGQDAISGMEELASCCVVYPDRAEVLSHLDRYPGLAPVLFLAINQVAEGDERARAGKPQTSGEAPDKT